MPTITAPTAPITATEDAIQTPASSLLDVAVANAKHRVLVPEAMLDGAPEDTQERAAAPRLPAASVVVTLDDTEFSHAALEPAIDMARRFDQPLVIVRVPRPAHNPFLEDDLDRELGETNAIASLSRAAARARAHGLQVWEVLGRDSQGGSPAAAILRAAEKFHASMIVMATHARTGLSRALHGSVASEVLQQAPMPVLLVRPSGPPV
jgi:nucleotide-binding universal stress UspA family protein